MYHVYARGFTRVLTRPAVDGLPRVVLRTVAVQPDGSPECLGSALWLRTASPMVIGLLGVTVAWQLAGTAAVVTAAGIEVIACLLLANSPTRQLASGGHRICPTGQQDDDVCIA